MAAFDVTYQPGPGAEPVVVRLSFDDPAYGRPPGSPHAYGPPNEVLMAELGLEDAGALMRVEFVPEE